MIPRTVLKSLAVLPAAAVLMIAGCSPDDGLGSRYSVSGRVTYKGAAVPKGTIGFVSENPAVRGATGQIEDGSYTLTTQTPGDGALPGKYTVTISSKEPIDVSVASDALKAEFAKKKMDISKLPTANLPPEFLAKAAKKVKSSLPEKYASPKTSQLSATVEEKSNIINFNLED